MNDNNSLAPKLHTIPVGSGIITGIILWINDPPPEEELVETYGEIEIVGDRVRVVD